MSAAEVKETRSNLKAWIDDLTDPDMLSLLDGLRVANAEAIFWDCLSEFEKENINAGLDDIQNGRVMSSEKFWDELKNG